MKTTTRHLSKSRFQTGRQCHKRMWLELHRRDLIAWSDAAQARFDEGTRFGELARELLGGGLLIDAEHFLPQQAQAQTSAALSQTANQVPMLFEPAFEHNGVRIRADALQRLPQGERLIEVKSATLVKDEYLWDCAIQTWVMRGAGRPVTEIRLGHIDNGFVLTREGDYAGLLKQTEITTEVEHLLPTVTAIVDELKAVAAGPEPTIATGPHCFHPYDCPFQDYCRAKEPPAPDYPIEDLPYAGKLIDELHEAGYADLRDIPPALLYSQRHHRIAQAAHSGEAYIAPQLREELTAIGYPRHYLDFETISFAVPRWLGTRPFQQIPFQFSCHVEQADGQLEHRAFLDLSGASPIASFADALLSACGNDGPILVWNQGFESSRIRDLATFLPDRADALLALIERMIDLLPIYRAHYYHRDMHGSWSIKAVLPTIAPELDYGELDIGDGGNAQVAWLRAVSPETGDAERETLRRNLLAYCERDTLAMVRLAKV